MPAGVMTCSGSRGGWSRTPPATPTNCSTPAARRTRPSTSRWPPAWCVAARAAGAGFEAAELLATILMFADRPAEAIEVLDGVRDDVTTGTRTAKWYAARGSASFWGPSNEDITKELTTVGESLTDPADRAWVHSYVAIQRLHLLECDEALRLARAVLDRPAASGSPRALALSTLAHLHAVRGQTTKALQMSAPVENSAASWRMEMPYIQLALELARGTALILAGDVAGVDTIAAGDFADLSDAGEFHLGSGHLSLVAGQAAWLPWSPGRGDAPPTTGLRGAGDRTRLRRAGQRRTGAHGRPGR